MEPETLQLEFFIIDGCPTEKFSAKAVLDEMGVNLSFKGPQISKDEFDCVYTKLTNITNTLWPGQKTYISFE